MAPSPPASFWGAAHGASAESGRLVSSEPKPSNELRSVTPPDTVRRDHDANGRFVVGNAVARSKRLRAGLHGALTKLEAQADPAWVAANVWGKRYAAHRRGELARAHGGKISAAVGALTEDEATLRTDARYLRARGMAEGNADLIKTAASLLAQARGAARDAWELASREAFVRPPIDAGSLARLLAEGSKHAKEDR